MVKTAVPLAVLLAAACTSPAAPRAVPSTSPPPSSVAPTSPRPTPTPSLPQSFGGEDVRWPRTAESTTAPRALGAVVTLRVARTGDGGTLAAGLTLPRTGGSAAAPVVMTPCGRSVALAARDLRVIAPSGDDVLVVIDPSHGGPQLGAVAPNGDREKDRVLQIALEARTALAGRVGRVVLTRERDYEETLGFRAALVDALRADAAVSVHLNASPDGPRTTPGTETFGSTADGEGRRFSGVVYERIRRYLQTLPGPWVGDRDAGAKYRVSAAGRDYYGLLRLAHRPFVIAESLYLSSPHEAALVARPDVRRALGTAIADALVAFTTTAAPGSGWVTPYARPADPNSPDRHVCVDP
ncbi:MAG: N-acetylmuramoyl-L-alanine amidase [Frankiaceae bacterium]|jgi:N-acetylmuramoyl-L-alanine amidase|nr:N-acetylmuramoyl-L-alanine amidase [Frankiaceae bacterium]